MIEIGIVEIIIGVIGIIEVINVGIVVIVIGRIFVVWVISKIEFSTRGPRRVLVCIVDNRVVQEPRPVRLGCYEELGPVYRRFGGAELAGSAYRIGRTEIAGSVHRIRSEGDGNVGFRIGSARVVPHLVLVWNGALHAALELERRRAL